MDGRVAQECGSTPQREVSTPLVGMAFYLIPYPLRHQTRRGTVRFAFPRSVLPLLRHSLLVVFHSAVSCERGSPFPICLYLFACSFFALAGQILSIIRDLLYPFSSFSPVQCPPRVTQHHGAVFRCREHCTINLCSFSWVWNRCDKTLKSPSEFWLGMNEYEWVTLGRQSNETRISWDGKKRKKEVSQCMLAGHYKFGFN